MRGRVVLGLLATLGIVLSGVLPAQAQEELPQLAALRSMRHEYVETFRGEPGVVCSVEWESAQRLHGVCNDLVSIPNGNFVAGRVTEGVEYDGIRYERVDSATTWTATPVEDYDPARSLNAQFFDLVTPGTPNSALARSIVNLGSEQLQGVATTHYQIWIHDEAFNAEQGGQVTYDIWVDGGGFPLKDQFNTLDIESEGLGRGRVEAIWSYRDFNTPITVSPPPADAVVPGEANATSVQALWNSAAAMQLMQR